MEYAWKTALKNKKEERHKLRKIKRHFRRRTEPTMRRFPSRQGTPETEGETLDRIPKEKGQKKKNQWEGKT